MCSLWSVAAMAGSVKLFRNVKGYYQTIGLLTESQSKHDISFNPRNLFALFSIFQRILTTFAFFVYEAETLLEYGLTFFVYVAEAYSIVVFLEHMSTMPKTLHLIEHFEKFIEKSNQQTHAKLKL